MQMDRTKTTSPPEGGGQNKYFHIGKVKPCYTKVKGTDDFTGTLK